MQLLCYYIKTYQGYEMLNIVTKCSCINTAYVNSLSCLSYVYDISMSYDICLCTLKGVTDLI